MNLIYYKADIGNFGDDLNPWLWERIFGDFSQYSDEYDFIGIGSQLDSRIETGRKKIIFGAGIRDFLYTPRCDNNLLDLRFVRGPISSKVFNNAKYITDAAYCLGLLDKQEYIKKYTVAYMPYFRHVPYYNWALFEKWSGIKVILPTNPMEQVIQEINESERLLTSAMHGAIVADVYRVPWMRVRFPVHGYEPPLVSELKWADWYKSIGFEDLDSIAFGFSLNKRSNSRMDDILKGIFMSRKLKKGTYILSDQSVLEQKISQLKEEVDYIKHKYKK